MEYVISTLNCRGLRDAKNRKRVFEYFKEKMYDIIMLQETHSTELDEKKMEK